MAAWFRRIVPQLPSRRLVPQFHWNCRHSSASSTFQIAPDFEAKIRFQRMMAKRPYPHVNSFKRVLSRMEEKGYYDVAIDMIKEMLQGKARVNPLILEVGMKCFCKIGHPLLALGLVGAFHKLGCEPCCGLFILFKPLEELERSPYTDYVVLTMFRLAKAFHGRPWSPHCRPCAADLVFPVSVYQVPLPHPNSITKLEKLGIPKLDVEEQEVQQEADGFSVYIVGLSMSATEDFLGDIFSKFGTITNNGIQVRSDKQQGICVAIVKFEDAISMQKAIEASPVTVGECQTLVAEKKSINSRGPPLAARKAPPKSLESPKSLSLVYYPLKNRDLSPVTEEEQESPKK